MNDRTAGAVVDIVLNGERRALADGTSVADLVDPEWGRGVAVARNGEVVPRADWGRTRVEPGDEIEIVHPIQGG